MSKPLPVQAKYTEYKGHPIIVLTDGPSDRYPVQFGVAKARRILTCIDDIRRFVAEADIKDVKKTAAKMIVNAKMQTEG